jgi:hypothetical protein
LSRLTTGKKTTQLVSSKMAPTVPNLTKLPALRHGNRIEQTSSALDFNIDLIGFI